MGEIPDTPALVDGILSRIDDHLSTRVHVKENKKIQTEQEEDQYENKKAKSIREQYRHGEKFAGDIDEKWVEKLEDFVQKSKIKTTDRQLYM